MVSTAEMNEPSENKPTQNKTKSAKDELSEQELNKVSGGLLEIDGVKLPDREGSAPSVSEIVVTKKL